MKTIVSYVLAATLFGVAAFLWTAPVRREAQLRGASLAELQAWAKAHDSNDARLLYYLGKRHREAGQSVSCKYLDKAVRLAPGDAEIWGEAARAARLFYGADKAAALLETFVRNNPDNAAGRAARAEEYLRDQRNDDAEAEAQEALKRDANNADALRILALCQSAKNQIAEAETNLRKAVAADPKNAEAQAALGDLLSDQRKYAEAISLYRAALTIDFKLPAANTMLALALLASDSKADVKEAVDLALRGVKGDDGSYLAHFALGKAYQRAGDFARATQEFDTTRLMTPTFADAYFQLAETAKRAGQTQEEILWRRKHRAMQLFLAEKDVRQSQNRAAADDPQKLHEKAVEFARYLAQNGDYGAALSVYRDLIAADTTPSPRAGEWNALINSSDCQEYLLLNTTTYALLKRGRDAFSARRLTEAFSCFMAMIRRDRTNTQALDFAGYVASQQGNAFFAVKLWKDSLRIDPNHAAPYFKLAEIAAGLRLDDEARWYVRQYLRLTPQSGEGWFLLGDLLRDDPAQAEPAFEKAIAFDSGVEPHSNEALYQTALGEMRAANNKIPEAETAFQAALKRAPASPDVLLSYGAFLTEHTDRYADAVTILEKARTESPNDPALWYQLGLAYGKKGDLDRAIAALETARRGPLRRDATYALSQLYQKKGDATKANALRAEAVALQRTFLATMREGERQATLSPEFRLRLARERANTPERVQALWEYEAYLKLRPTDEAVRKERDALARSLAAEGIAPPQNGLEIIRELRNYKELPPITQTPSAATPAK